MAAAGCDAPNARAGAASCDLASAIRADDLGTDHPDRDRTTAPRREPDATPAAAGDTRGGARPCRADGLAPIGRHVDADRDRRPGRVAGPERDLAGHDLVFGFSPDIAADRRSRVASDRRVPDRTVDTIAGG
jgi:hypothetical protein